LGPYATSLCLCHCGALHFTTSFYCMVLLHFTAFYLDNNWGTSLRRFESEFYYCMHLCCKSAATTALHYCMHFTTALHYCMNFTMALHYCMHFTTPTFATTGARLCGDLQSFHASAFLCAYVSIRQHASAFAAICDVFMRQRSSKVFMINSPFFLRERERDRERD